ncbi:MAG: Rieske 2Fe-2S domain-containing protein [Patescibacteria group bacterium]|jgi:3-phenylpropionate/trans-cinnamate dioxygenase ferredoxin subunit
MSFKTVVQTSEVPVGTMKRLNTGDQEILVANVGGSFYAINNKCPHMGGSLADGKLDGSIVHCPRHGSMFDVKTGKNVKGAKIAFVKMKVKDTMCYPVQVSGTDVLVDIEGGVN